VAERKVGRFSRPNERAAIQDGTIWDSFEVMDIGRRQRRSERLAKPTKTV
jgi:hypothetical protein